MPGANLKFRNPKQLWTMFMELLGQRAQVRRARTQLGFICLKAGAPVSNTAADDPGKAGVICVDTTNKHLYVCTAYTNPTTHTWTKIT